MKLKRLSFLWIVPILLLTDCYQAVDLSVPFEGSRMVLDGYLSPQKGLDLWIKKTFDPYLHSEFGDEGYFVTKARVHIWKDGVLIDSCQEISKGHYLSLHPEKYDANETYQVQISAHDLPNVIVHEIVIPKESLVLPESFSFILDRENKISMLETTFLNPDYYAIYHGKAWYDSHTKNALDLSLQSVGSSELECDDDWRYASNKCEAGSSFKKNYFLYPYERIDYPWGDKVFLPKNYIYIEIGQIDPLFKKYIEKSDSSDEPFIEPTLDPGNAEGGYGFIVGWNTMSFTYRL